MCANCYHRRGRSKKAWACPHPRKTHYSKGLCKYCYLSNYYKSRTAKGGRIPASKMPTEKMLKELADNSNSEDLERLLNQDEPMNQADNNSDSQPLQGNLTQEDKGKIASKQQNCTLKEADECNEIMTCQIKIQCVLFLQKLIIQERPSNQYLNYQSSILG